MLRIGARFDDTNVTMIGIMQIKRELESELQGPQQLSYLYNNFALCVMYDQ